MGTRATIKFKDGDEEYFVYRGHDGFPENVQVDIDNTIKSIKGLWSGAECGLLVSCFLGRYYDGNSRIQDYMLTTSFHTDESFRYFVEWNDEKKEWLRRYEPKEGL